MLFRSRLYELAFRDGNTMELTPELVDRAFARDERIRNGRKVVINFTDPGCEEVMFTLAQMNSAQHEKANYPATRSLHNPSRDYGSDFSASSASQDGDITVEDGKAPKGGGQAEALKEQQKIATTLLELSENGPQGIKVARRGTRKTADLGTRKRTTLDKVVIQKVPPLASKASIADNSTSADTDAGNKGHAKDVLTVPHEGKVGKDETNSGGDKSHNTPAAAKAPSNQVNTKDVLNAPLEAEVGKDATKSVDQKVDDTPLGVTAASNKGDAKDVVAAPQQAGVAVDATTSVAEIVV